MAQPGKPQDGKRPARKTPEERSAEFDATQKQLKKDAAARHEARVAKEKKSGK